MQRRTADAALDAAIKEEITQRKEAIETLLGETKFVRVPPSSLGDPGCLVGTLSFCVNFDGEIVPTCTDPQGCDSANPLPSECPEVCEDEGNIVVIDHRETSCAQKYVSFVCLTPEDYDSRLSCQEGTILNYNSDKNGWVCEPPVPDLVHVSTSVFDLIGTISLFERARINLIREDLQRQIDDINQPN